MDVSMPVVAWGVVGLLSALIGCRARTGCERARVTAVPARQELRIRGVNETPEGKRC
jgi:hypothetical protein